MNKSTSAQAGYSVIEVGIGSSLSAIMMMVMFGMSESTSTQYKTTRAASSKFKKARAATTVLKEELKGATAKNVLIEWNKDPRGGTPRCQITFDYALSQSGKVVVWGIHDVLSGKGSRELAGHKRRYRHGLAKSSKGDGIEALFKEVISPEGKIIKSEPIMLFLEYPDGFRVTKSGLGFKVQLLTRKPDESEAATYRGHETDAKVVDEEMEAEKAVLRSGSGREEVVEAPPECTKRSGVVREHSFFVATKN